MMSKAKWIFHPILIFVFSIMALGLSLFLYIYWYIKVSQGLKHLIEKLGLHEEQVLASQTWVVILVLSILVGIILMGIFIIFVYNMKTVQLYRLQNNFINNFTHELKTPVTSLKLYLETFLQHDLPRNERTKYLGYMLTDVNRLAENINCILSLAKIESKTFAVEFIETELTNEVEKFIESNKHLFDGMKIEIHNPGQNRFFYPIEPSLFEMLLMNILTNSLKYNNSDSPAMDILFASEKDKCKIVFKDNGIGLSKKDIKKIFKKFYQAVSGDGQSIAGSGIGLYLAQNIAKLHKGKITAQSKGPGKGSEFTIILPF